MSEQPTAPSSGGGGNVFTRKLGPFPMWIWMALVLLAAVAYRTLSKGKSSSSADQAAGNAPGGVDSSLVPQFVNQTFTQSQPPPAPNITINNNEGKTTPPAPTSPLNEVLAQGHAISTNPHKAVIGWTIKQKSPNATQLKVVLNGPGVKNQIRYVPASATTATFDNLKGGHTYVADVTPMDSSGQAVGGPNHVSFVTSKQ